MSTETQEILNRALELPAADKARIADELLASLNQPDEAIDALWKKGSRRPHCGIQIRRTEIRIARRSPREIPQVDGNLPSRRRLPPLA